MDNTPPKQSIALPTYEQLQQQAAELIQENSQLKAERDKIVSDANTAKGETNKTNKKAENLAILLGSQISEFKPQQLTEFEKNHQNAETQLMLWATDASAPNEKRLTQALYITYLMRAANKDIQMRAFAQAKDEAKRLISNDLPITPKD